MANWLDKALGKKETVAVDPVPFARTCCCGFQLSGLRHERAKRVICGQCGVAHFVLPTNPYPVSERIYFKASDAVASEQRTSQRRRPDASPKTQLDVTVDFDSPTDVETPITDEIESATEPELDLVEAAWSSTSDQKPKQLDHDDDGGDDYELADSDAEIDLKSPTAGTRGWERNEAVDPVEQLALQRAMSRGKRVALGPLNDGRRSQRVRIVAVVGLILFVAGAMIFWTARGRKLERAEIAMREGRDIGEVALNNRDFATARSKLRQSVEAMDLLGIDIEQRQRTRRLWLQAEAGFGLLDDTDVIEIALAAEETLQSGDAEEWQRRFRAQYLDRWLSIQLEPVEIVSGDEVSGQRVVFPAMPRVHLAGLDEILKQQNGGRLWFAGPVKACRRDPLDDSAWLIEFDSSRCLACDGTESLVRPMLTEEQQTEVRTARAAEVRDRDGNE
ncbi:MAG: hypothetical protein O3B13_19155 [Planctomycetota bacterium]|nr:hypothetical protein [Planctomycetota bacterium]